MTQKDENRIVDAVLLRLGKVLLREIKAVVSTPDQPRYASPAEVHTKYGIKPATIRAMVRRGEIKGRTGKPFLVDIPSLEAWIEDKKPGDVNHFGATPGQVYISSPGTRDV